MSKSKSISRQFGISFPESQFPGRKTCFDQKLMPSSVWFSQVQKIQCQQREDPSSPVQGTRGWNHPNASPAPSVGLTRFLVGMLPASSIPIPSHGARSWSHPCWPAHPRSQPSPRRPVAVLPLPCTAHQTEEVATAELLKAFFWWRPPVLRD